jgi:hypothetical protein
MERKMFNTLAKAKLVKNTKLKTLRLIVAFNVYETRKQFDNVVWKFPVQSKCDFVSGDLQVEDVLNAVETAKKVLRTDNIVFVD